MMSYRAATAHWQRRVLVNQHVRRRSRSHQQQQQQQQNQPSFLTDKLALASMVASATALTTCFWPVQAGLSREHTHDTPILTTTAGQSVSDLVKDDEITTVPQRLFLFLPPQTVYCDKNMYDDEYDDDLASGYTETERFLQCLDYHRALLFDYQRRWDGDDADDSHIQQQPPSQQQPPPQQPPVTSQSTLPLSSGTTTTVVVPPVAWPRDIPTAEEVPSLELDLRFCRMSPAYRDNRRECQNLAFRIASYYLSLRDDTNSQWKGYQIVKDLAENGHPDGMCLYAMILYNGLSSGVIPKQPAQAIIWWRRCVDLHRHITATYELAVALYTAEGEGVTENSARAVQLFRQAAHLGHVGAAYMLGECLLDGVGGKRDRALALEWLVTAAELGHHVARRRVVLMLRQDYDDDEDLEAIQKERITEAEKWINRYAGEEQLEQSKLAVQLERRHTRGALPPKVAARRRSKVMESRDVDISLSSQNQ